MGVLGGGFAENVNIMQTSAWCRLSDLFYTDELKNYPQLKSSIQICLMMPPSDHNVTLAFYVSTYVLRNTICQLQVREPEL